MSPGYFVAAGVLIATGLALDSRFPHPDQTAAAPEFIAADQAERQAIEERFERLVLEIRLLKLGEERREFGAKEFPAATPGLRWGAK